MKRKDLQAALKKANIPDWKYDLTGAGRGDNQYVLESRKGKWRVYYLERGAVHQERLFDKEDDACAFLSDVLLSHGITDPLPLGSVVRLRGGTLKLLIVSRGLRVPGKNGKVYYFDYGAVAYPNGLVTTDMAYFQQESVDEVYHWGYSDEDDMRVLESIHYYLDTHHDIERGNPEAMGD